MAVRSDKMAAEHSFSDRQSTGLDPVGQDGRLVDSINDHLILGQVRIIRENPVLERSL
jgi:hypothetical protein